MMRPDHWTLAREVVPADLWQYCSRCRFVNELVFTQSGALVRGDCSNCNRYVAFARLRRNHPQDIYPALYEEALPW